MLTQQTIDTIKYALNYALTGYHVGHISESPPTIYDRLLAALANLDAGGERWEPVEEDYWGYLNVERKGRVLTVATDTELEMDKGYMVVPLPENVYVCRRVPSPALPLPTEQEE